MLLVDSFRARHTVLYTYNFPAQNVFQLQLPTVLRTELHELVKNFKDADRKSPNFPFVGKDVYNTDAILHSRPFSGKDALMPAMWKRHNLPIKVILHLNIVSFMQNPPHVLFFIWPCGHWNVSDLHLEPLSPWLTPHFLQEACLSGHSHILPALVSVSVRLSCVSHTQPQPYCSSSRACPAKHCQVLNTDYPGLSS